MMRINDLKVLQSFKVNKRILLKFLKCSIPKKYYKPTIFMKKDYLQTESLIINKVNNIKFYNKILS